MKKNLISVIILALVLANLILTVVLTISVLPQSKKANELIEKVCNAIDLDLTDGGYAAQEMDVPRDKIKNFSLNGGENLTINLKPGADGVEHYALIKVTIGMNSEHDDYKTFGTEEMLQDKEPNLTSIVTTVVSQHTSEDLRNDIGAIQEEVRQKICEMYGSNLVVEVLLPYTIS